MKISVIVPVYNAEKYLAECVNSILNQTYADFELILVNDGSVDGSGALCDLLAEKDGRIRVIHKENGGVSSARNTGIKASDSEYLAFIDADDWVEPNYLEELIGIIGNSDLAICGVDDRENGALPEEQISTQELCGHPSRYAKHPYINYSVNKLYRSVIVEEEGLHFPEKMKRGEDAVFVASYIRVCKKIAVSPKILYHYRENMDSAMHNFSFSMLEDEAKLMKVQYDFFHSRHIPLSYKEENFYRIWRHGKCLAILKDIDHYMSDRSIKDTALEELLNILPKELSLYTPPMGTGKKCKIVAWTLQHKMYRLFWYVIRKI